MKNAHQPPQSNRFPSPGIRTKLHVPLIPAALAGAALLALAPLADATPYTWNLAGGNWNSDASWLPNTGFPGTGNTALFGNTAASANATTINNYVNGTFTIAGLTNNSVSTALNIFVVTSIGNGDSLTVTGPVLIGGLNEGTGGYTTYQYMTGQGTFMATGPTFTVQNYGSASGANACAFLNLLGLNNFVYSNSIGTVSIEDNPGTLTRLGGSVTFALVSNYITASNLNLGTSTSAQAGPSGTINGGLAAVLTLGPGTNIFNVANLNLANNKSTYTIAAPASPAPGGLRIRGVSGADTDRPTITIGNRNQTGTGTCLGTMSLAGIPVDIKAGTLTVGANPNTGTTTGDTGTGVLIFDTGTVDATTINMANTATLLGNANGSIDVNYNGTTGGTLLVGGGGISLATQLVSTGVATGTLNIANGATVTCDGNITEAVTNVAAGTGNLNLGGTLNMGLDTSIGAQTISTTNLSINNFTLSNNATLQLSPLSGGQTNIFVNTLNWPSPDSSMTIDIAGLPAGAANGSNYVLINTINQISQGPNYIFGGSLNLPNTPGGTLTGTVAVDGTGTNVVLTITGGVQGPLPATPTLSGALEGNQIVLNWTDDPATSYDILRSTTGQPGSYQFIAEDYTAGTTYTDSSVVSGVGFYYYEVIGVNGNGASAPSSPAVVPYGLGNQLVNPGFELLPAKTGWTSATNTYVITTNASTYYLNGTNGACAHDATAEYVVSHSGTNVARLCGSSNAVPNTAFLQQTIPTIGGSTLTAGALTYVSHEDLMAGKNSFYYQMNFLDGGGNLLACYQSFIVSNLTCGETSPFPVDTWVFLGLTNQMGISGNASTGVVIGTSTNGVLTAPGGAENVQFQAIFIQQNAHDGGSAFMDDAEMVLLTGPVPPTLSAITPIGITLCTNTTLTCTATAAAGNKITNMQVIITTTTLGGVTSTTTTNSTFTSNGLTGVINYPLVPNTVYPAIVVKATDQNGVTVTSPTGILDTLVPVLVIEGSDYNFNGGYWYETPANGGVSAYQSVAAAVTNVDYGGVTRTNAGNTYRVDPVIVLGAGSTSQTEQKFVTPAGTEMDVGYNFPGEWQDYTRSFGSGPYVTAAANEEAYNAGYDSAPAGTYNIWLFSATSGTGPQEDLYLVTNTAPVTSTTQGLSYLGVFGTTNYANTSYNNYVYLPMLDQYGNFAQITLSGTVTLRGTVAPSPANPNIGFYMLTAPVPVYTPSLTYAYPNGTNLFEAANLFTFTVTNNAGADILTSGVTLSLNGVNVSSGLTFTPVGTAWNVSYPIYQNEVYTVVVTVTNTTDVGKSYTFSFDTFSTNNYTWEAVDYDFTDNSGSGQFIDNPVPSADNNAIPVTQALSTGELATNSYYDWPGGSANIGISFGYEGIDIGWITSTTPLQVENYRADAAVQVATQPATDLPLRAKFVAAQTEFSDPLIGPFNICYYTNGSWLNYTRHYPTNTFHVWGRLAGTPAYTNTQMTILTSGYGTSIQTTNLLGTFSDPNAAGFQAWHWIPLLDANSNQVEVTLGSPPNVTYDGPGGIETLQVISGSDGSCNLQFFMLVPVPPPFSLTPSLGAGGTLNLSFPTESGVQYTILHTSSLSSPDWVPAATPIIGDGNVDVVNMGVTQGYFTGVAH